MSGGLILAIVCYSFVWLIVFSVGVGEFSGGRKSYSRKDGARWILGSFIWPLVLVWWGILLIIELFIVAFSREK